MKKIILIVAFFASFVEVNGQGTFPTNQSIGNSAQNNLLYTIYGAPYSTVGSVMAKYADTTAANSNPYIRNYSFAQIATYNDGKVWFRNYAKTAWVELANTSGGIGTVTSVGALSPLFTTANPTTTPTFSLISQSANKFFASPDGSAGVASFRSIATGDLPSLSSLAWVYDGNPVAAVRSIGTTTGFGLKFLTNNIQSGYIDIVNQNTSFGEGTLLNNTSGSGVQNTAIGYQALTSNTTGINNTAIGYSVMNGNTTGGYNTAIGISAVTGNTTGGQNTGVGYNALAQNRTGSNNTAIGFNALGADTSDNNTAIGLEALGGTVSGSGNIAVGRYAGVFNTTASDQIFINSINRVNYTGDQTKSPVYIQQNISVPSQNVTLNGNIFLPYTTSQNNVGDSIAVILPSTGKIGYRSPSSIVAATPTLLAVTTAGNTTTKGIVLNTAILTPTPSTGLSLSSSTNAQLQINSPSSNVSVLDFSGVLGGGKTFTFPNNTGTVALTSDIPSGSTYILNQTGQQSSSNFNISGVGVAPEVDGSTVANGDLLINGTSSATKATSYVDIQSTGGWVGIRTNANNLAVPLHIGASTYNPAVDPVILNNRNVDNTGSGNAHSFVDASYIIRDGGIGYNSYDAFPLISGTSSNYDHYAAFQSRPIYNNPGFTINNIFGTFTSLTNTAGTITNNFGHYADNPSNSGTITNNYAYFSEPQTVGSTLNYAFYSDGTTPSLFNGQLTLARAGAASTPSLLINGTMFSGGTATTTKPLALIESSGATSNTWSTAGGMLGVNSSVYTGYLFEGKANGVTSFGMNVTAAGGFADLKLGSYVADGVNGMGGRARFYRYEGTEAGNVYCTSDALLAINGTNGTTVLQIGGTEVARVTAAGLGIGTTSISASSILDVTSTTKGFLPPRMTATQASAISSPAEGLLIYVTDTNGTFTAKGWWGYSGAAWEKLNN